MRYNARTLLSIVLLPALAGACDSRSQSFWRPGATYTLTLIPNERAKLLQEVERSLGTPKDSVRGLLTVDSLRIDSVWGTFDVQLQEIGLLIPTVGRQPPRFAGSRSEDRFVLQLNTQVTDAGVWLEGTVSQGAAGSWKAAQRSLEGNFRLSPNGGSEP
jgi:hypothetical protein